MHLIAGKYGIRKGALCAKHDFFCHFSNCHHSKASELQAFHLVYRQFGPSMYFTHRFKVRSYSTPPVLSDEPSKNSIKWQLSNAIDVAFTPTPLEVGVAQNS